MLDSCSTARWKTRGRGPGVRGTGFRGVENTGSGGKHGVWWKTRGLSGKHGFLVKKTKTRGNHFFANMNLHTKMRSRNFVSLNCNEINLACRRENAFRAKARQIKHFVGKKTIQEATCRAVVSFAWGVYSISCSKLAWTFFYL